MGRLTLNVLLSFAQFEREVTAERIRDKIAASKKKGMWMGGVVPLGYRVENRKLLIEEQEATTVRHLFDRYLALGSVRLLAEEALATGLVGRASKTTLNGSTTKPGNPFGRGNLYHLLSNPIYIGKIRHRDQIHAGEHKPLVEADVFTRTQTLLGQHAPARSSSQNHPGAHLLTGIVFDETGDRLSPIHSNKAGKRYFYYISSRLVTARRKDKDGWRVPAAELESVVKAQLNRILNDQPQLADWIQEFGHSQNMEKALAAAEQHCSDAARNKTGSDTDLLRKAFSRIELHSDSLALQVDRSSIVAWLIGSSIEGQSQTGSADDPSPFTLTVPITIKRRGVETRMVLSNGAQPDRKPDPALIQLIAKAHAYLATLTNGSATTLTQVSIRHHTELSEVSRILPLAFLSPAITDAIMTGRQPVSLTAQRLLRLSALPILWREQSDLLG